MEAETGGPGPGSNPGRVTQPSVAVLRLDLTDFRNHASARIEAGGQNVVLTGPNGAGKTNILEALSFLAPGRGLRRARLSEIDRRAGLHSGRDTAAAAETAGAWSVSARLTTPAGGVAIGTGRDGKAETGDRRIVRIDGQTAKGQTVLAGLLNLVWLTPQMDRLFQEGASPRRRFLDRLVFGHDAEHASRLAAYEQALRERARLLRLGGADPQWLGVLEETMAREGTAVAAARRDIVDRLDAAASAEGSEQGPFPVPSLELAGEIDRWLLEAPALAVEERFRATLQSGRRLDGEIGGAAQGPHRSDFIVRHRRRDVAAAACSTGEQKALLIAIVLAHARLQADLRGAPPVLLLDEVAAHLDAVRRAALFEAILALGSQAWLTGTDRPFFEPLGAHARFFDVSEGHVETGIPPGD